MHKLRCDTYHIRAAIEAIGEKRANTNWKHWTLEESRAVSKRQHEMREDLGIPHPQAGQA